MPTENKNKTKTQQIKILISLKEMRAVDFIYYGIFVYLQ